NGQKTARLWCDAHWPRLVVEVNRERPGDVRVEIDDWRERPRELQPREIQVLGLDSRKAYIAQTDNIVPDLDRAIAWHQRNESSIWADTLDPQGLGDFKEQSADPLLGLTFGGLIQGENFKRKGDRALVTAKKTRAAAFTVTMLSWQTPTLQAWIEEIVTAASTTDSPTLAEAWRDHTAWWAEFWARSHINATLRDSDWCNPEQISLQMRWHRFLTACCSRGAFPAKFNGGLFTADWGVPGESYDADYRRWGGGYWWQNTRLIYWSMLANGDYDLMRPLFRMYRDILPLAEHRTQKWFGHGGAFFPETQYFWGAMLPENYGLDREGKAPHQVENQYIRHCWHGGLELLVLMLDTHAHTGEDALLVDDLLPIARAVLKFYALHYPTDAQGRLVLKPAQALETWWEVENPMPEVAGLHVLLPRLLALPDGKLEATDLGAWRALKARLPQLPIGTRDGLRRLLPAAKIMGTPRNSENPELYAVFPYKLFGIGRPDLELARNTFLHRTFPDTGGWRQDAIHAALLCIPNTAAYYVHRNCENSNQAQVRFKGFCGPNYDWIPDFDQSSVAQIALQTMLVQTVGDRIYLFPSWPSDRWNVSFKLNAPNQTTIECELADGIITHLSVYPPERRRDVVVLLGQDVSHAATLASNASA
ncbi:MAG: hypothetical protein IT582_04720, partial [Opitutaceae bacterium]|nr:hypothetical protein [Opitutaceae bacterium]